MKDGLIKQAKEARQEAYVPYSYFPVGAAVLVDGKIYTGCNIENASFSLSNCAERTAMFKAISVGHQKIEAMAVVADTDDPVSPCGSCRQVMAEFSDETTKIFLTNLSDQTEEWKVHELLPGAFQADDMNH